MNSLKEGFPRLRAERCSSRSSCRALHFGGLPLVITEVGADAALDRPAENLFV